MVEIGVREFNSSVSAWLDRVEAGEIVTVTRRGKPVARVTPAWLPEHVARALATGRATWRGGTVDLPATVRLTGAGPTGSDYISEGRR